MGASGRRDDGAAPRSAGSRAVLAEPSEIEAPEGEDSTRLPNGFSRRYMRYTATSPLTRAARRSDR